MSATLSSHILDTHLGRPAADIAVTLRRVHNHSNATLLAHGTTKAMAALARIAGSLMRPLALLIVS